MSLDFCISFIHSFNLLRHIHACELSTDCTAYMLCIFFFSSLLFDVWIKNLWNFLLSCNPVILEAAGKNWKIPSKWWKIHFWKRKHAIKFFFSKFLLRQRREGKKSKQNVKLWAICTTTYVGTTHKDMTDASLTWL